MGTDTYISFAIWQQSEQTLAGVAVDFQYPLCRFLTPPLSLIMGNDDVLGSFNHPLQSLPVLGHGLTMPFSNVSSQNVKVHKNLFAEFSLSKFPRVVETFLCFFLNRVVMCDDQERFSVMVIPVNLKLFCCSSASLMQTRCVCPCLLFLNQLKTLSCAWTFGPESRRQI